MGSRLHVRCGSAVRLLLLAGLAAMAWLIWAAGAADAAPTDPSSGSSSSGVVLLDDGPTAPVGEATAAAVAVAHPLKSVAAQVLPAASGPPSAPVAGLLPAVQVPSVQLPPVPVPVPVSGTVESVVNTSAAVANDAAATVVTTAITTVDTTAVPLLTGAAALVDQVADVVPVTLPRSPVKTAPVALTETAAPRAGETHPSVAAASQDAKASAGARLLEGPGLTPPQFLFGARAVPEMTAAAGHVAPSTPPNAPNNVESLLRLFASQGNPGSSSGGIDGQAAADVPGSWSPQDTGRSARMPDATPLPAASPSFDPGSSPD